MRWWWRPMQVTVQNVLRGQRPQHRLERLGRGVDPARDAEHQVDPHRRVEDPLLEPADRAHHVADVEGLDLERDPGLGRRARRSPAGRRRGDEGLVAEVHRAGLDAGDVGLRLQAGRALLDRHVVGAAGRDHRQQVSPARSGRSRRRTARGGRSACRRPRGRGGGRPSPRRRAASIAESAISSVVYGMFGLFSRKTSAPVTATVRTTGSLFQAT